MKRTRCRFSRSLISANGRGDATILRPRARRPLHNTADLKERHEMDAHVKGRPSRSSPTRFGKAALLDGQWGRSQGSNQWNRARNMACTSTSMEASARSRRPPPSTDTIPTRDTADSEAAACHRRQCRPRSPSWVAERETKPEVKAAAAKLADGGGSTVHGLLAADNAGDGGSSTKTVTMSMDEMMEFARRSSAEDNNTPFKMCGRR